MEQEILLATILRVVLLITCPITFLVGIFLLYDVNLYTRIEKFLAKSYYYLSKGVILPKLEKNRENLQMFLLKRRRLVGIICLVNSALAIILISSMLNRF